VRAVEEARRASRASSRHTSPRHAAGSPIVSLTWCLCVSRATADAVNSPGAPAGRVGLRRAHDRPTPRGCRYHFPPALVGATPTIAGARSGVCGDLFATRALSMHTSWMGTPRIPSSTHPSSGTHWTSAPARHDVGALSLSPPPAPIALLPHRPPSGIQRAMPRKAKSSRPPRAAEQADYKTWLADAVAELQRQHNVNPSTIPCAYGGTCISKGAIRRRPPTRRQCPRTTCGRLLIGCGADDRPRRLQSARDGRTSDDYDVMSGERPSAASSDATARRRTGRGRETPAGRVP
jgi:hypothetical protein